MVGELAPQYLLLDQLLHLAQALEHPEIEVTAVDEGPDRVAIQPGVGLRRGQWPGLHPGVSLPVAPVLGQVVLECRKSAGQRTGVAEGPKAHVVAEHHAIRGARGQQAQHGLDQTDEELVVADRRGVVGIAISGEQEHQVDVGRIVQLAAPELAHADDHHGHRAAALFSRSARGTVASRHGLPGARIREGDGVVGERREVLHRFFQRSQSSQVAPGDAHHLATPPAPQPRLQGRLARSGLGPFARRPAALPARRTQMQQGCGPLQVREEFGVAPEGLRDELAAGEDVRRVAGQFRREIGWGCHPARLPNRGRFREA